jgi:vesicle coat complex subunit
LIFQDVKIFFINPSEPLYLKKEKVRLLFELCNDKNHKIIVSELLEYCYDPSPELSRLSLEMLWRIPSKIELALDSALKVFKKIINESKNNHFINHLFDEVCIGMHLLHRKFKQKANLEELIEMVLDNWQKILTSDAKCGYIYFFMKFAMKNKNEMSERAITLAEDFENEEDEVQLAILGAVMRAYLDFPNRLGETVKRVFTFASENSENPDLRDRAFIYWRLISNNFVFILQNSWRE